MNNMNNENNENDGCIIGITTDNRAVYSFEKMVQWLHDNHNMTEEEAIEWIDNNTLRAFL